MKRAPVNDAEKKEIGARIKRLRKEAGLRQWQLAELIGATQPAIHMYERGVLPEPKRLLELARIGSTTVEWILTGKHWENGSVDMPRVPREIYDLAFRFRDYSEEDREALGGALEVINNAVDSIQKAEKEEFDKLSVEEIAQRLKDFSRETRRARTQARAIRGGVAAPEISPRAKSPSSSCTQRRGGCSRREIGSASTRLQRRCTSCASP